MFSREEAERYQQIIRMQIKDMEMILAQVKPKREKKPKPMKRADLLKRLLAHLEAIEEWKPNLLPGAFLDENKVLYDELRKVVR